MVNVSSGKRRVDTSWVHFVAAQRASRLLAGHGFEAYVIGGAVRDIVLGALPKDFDLVTNATPGDIQHIKQFGKASYKDTAQAYGVSRVRLEVKVGGQNHSSELEIATYRRDVEAHLGRKATKVEFTHLEDDINRRDFTINALALDLLNDYLVDVVEGLKDIEAKLVRFIGNPVERIQEDPLRILRGIRLKNQLGFSYEPHTEAGLGAAVKAGQLQQIATERLRQELSRMLIAPSRVEAMADLDSLGVLQQLLPEVVAMKGVPQPPSLHNEGDVYEHTLLALEALATHPSEELAWATLLHDVGKPPTIAHSDRIRFNEHYRVGAEIAQDILSRLHFPKKTTERITWMIHHHLAIDELPKMRPGRQRQMLGNPAFTGLLELHKADAIAALGKATDGTVDVSHPDFSRLEELWEQYQLEAHTKDFSLKSEHGIDGKWVQTHYQLSGQALGQALSYLDEAYLDGKIHSQQDAEKLLKTYLAGRSGA